MREGKGEEGKGTYLASRREVLELVLVVPF
jgi:hypothetical protein